jgi:branched-chain amino acid transport system permease protein
MNTIGQVLVLGLISGGIYGLLAVGIVLVYRGTGALNFAQGELGTLGLYAAWLVDTKWGLPWLLGAAAALAVAVAAGVLFERLVVRHMVEASRVSIAVATAGLLLFLIATETKWFGGDSPRPIHPPIGGHGIQMFGVFVSPTQMIALVVTIAVGVALTTLLRRTDFGLGVLAAAQDPVATRLVGIRLKRVSAFVWGAGAGVSALAALLIAPTVGFVTPGYATVLFVSGLAAAVVGGLTSLPGAFAGGLIVGVIEVGSGRVFSSTSLPDVRFVAIFAVILAVLIVRPDGVVAAFKAAR